MAKKSFAALLSLMLVFSIFAVASAIDGNSFAARANAEPGSDWAIPTNPAIPTDPAVPTDPAIPDDGKEPTLEDGIIVSADEHFCGCCHRHNHSKELFDRIKCFFCKLFSFFKKETDIVHKYVKISESAPTCSESGKTLYKCAVCRTSVTIIKPSIGHSFRNIPGRNPTCTETGYHTYAMCIICGYSTYLGEIPAKGHIPVIDAAVPATIDNTGLTEGSHCSSCGAVLVKQEIIPKLPGCNHSFEWKQVENVPGFSEWSNGTHIQTCTKCGVTTGVAVDCELGKIIYEKDGNGNDIIPTCYRSAKYYQECSVCGGKKQGSFKKLPHKYNADNKELTTVIKEATCTEPGKISVKCEICRSNAKTFETRALGHLIEDKELAEGESVKCARCGEDLTPEDFDYDDNEFITYVSGRYYYKGRAKTLTGYNAGRPVYDEAEITFAVAPGKSLYMKMPFDGSTEIGYLAYVEKNKWTGKNETKKYSETEYEGKRYYFYLDENMLKQINGDSNYPMDFPDPADKDFDTRIEGVDLRTAKQAQVVYRGNVCTRFTFEQKYGDELRVYMNGKKLLLIEKRNLNNVVTDATYFDFITPDIPTYMTTTNGQGKVLSGMNGLLEFSNYIGIIG